MHPAEESRRKDEVGAPRWRPRCSPAFTSGQNVKFAVAEKSGILLGNIKKKGSLRSSKDPFLRGGEAGIPRHDP